MCNCDKYPVNHHAGWCTPSQADKRDWAVFELITIAQWGNHASNGTM